MRVALLKKNAVATILAAPDDLDAEGFANFLIPMLEATGADSGQALRDDEACGPGYRVNGGKFEPPPADRAELLERVNVEAAAAIVSGYRHNGVTLSTSLAAQMRWLGAQANLSAIRFPFDVATVDERVYSVKDATEFATICAGIAAHIFKAHQAGVAAKKAIDP